MADSKIQWTDATWNPVTGCDRVSPGCANCYALTLAKRLKAMGLPGYQRDGGRASGPGFGVTLHPEKLAEPLRWRKPRMVFVNSMSDLFHEEIPDGFIDLVFAAMLASPQHTFQVLTKRPERARDWFESYVSSFDTPRRVWTLAAAMLGASRERGGWPSETWPLPNVWLGVSVENARYTWRADVLRQIPAAVRFISAEPLLGSLYPKTEPARRVAPQETGSRPVPAGSVLALEPRPDIDNRSGEGVARPATPDGAMAADPVRNITDPVRKPLDLSGINWLIIGGESSAGARPMRVEWARELITAGRNAGAAVFVKQLGSVWARGQWAKHDPKGGDPSGWPPDLRIREFPTIAIPL